LFLIRQVVVGAYQDYKTRSIKDAKRFEHFSNDILRNIVNSEPGLWSEYVFSLANLLTHIDLFEVSYELHLELIISFISGMSNQLTSSTTKTPICPFTNEVAKFHPELCSKLIKTLITFVVNGHKNPPNEENISNTFSSCSESSVFESDLEPVESANGWLSYMNPFKSNKQFVGKNTLSQKTRILTDNLSQHALTMVLLIANQAAPYSTIDPYKNLREAIFSFSHHAQTKQPSGFEFDLGTLYRWLAINQQMEISTLSLYTLMHQNVNMKAYILAQMDLDTITIPVLRVLYNINKNSSHHVYMALIILMMMTEDESFTELVHKIKLKDDDISWFEDKKLKNCSLGSLILLVLVRTIQYNMSKLRDQYLHTNCIAALGNLATKLQLLHAYAAQKFMKLFQLFVKKNRQNDMQDDEVSVVRNVIKVWLNIIAISTCNNLNDNVQLVFAILHQKSTFEQLRDDLNSQLRTEKPKTDDSDHSSSPKQIIQSTGFLLCLELINFYDKKINQMNDEGQALSAESVSQMISNSLRVFPRRMLHNRPVNDMKFNYMEEEASEEFFIPYIWHLCYTNCRVYWKPDAIRLFQL